jgi:hypothetical protein
MNEPKRDWSPVCSEYVSVGLLRDEGPGSTPGEVRLLLDTEEGGKFVLRCSLATASDIWGGLSVLLNDHESTV